MSNPSSITHAVFNGLPEEKDGDRKIILFCESKDLKFLDEKLWTLIPESFLPHSLETSQPGEIYLTSALSPPESLFDSDKSTSSQPIIFYLSQESLSTAFFEILKAHKIQEIHHLVGRNSSYREFCRTLFREYKKNGITVDYQSL
jgi:DNA polymerase IIIc chi subunit